MKIALIVDNPFRDLSGLILTAIRLCQYGATCYLVPMNLQWMEVGALAPDFLLLNHLYYVNQNFTLQLLDAGIKVGVLDTEEGVLPNIDSLGRFMLPDPAVSYRISCYCSWGDKLASYAREKEWYQDKQIVVTGSPRFDFYVSPWRKAALGVSSYADNFPKPIVLINSNFTLANPHFKSPEKEADMLIGFGYNKQQVLRCQKEDQNRMIEMVRLANRIADHFPDVTFIYRPHPFEKLETYHGLLEERPNLHLIKKGTVDGWILRASAIIQRGCSTAIEAGMAGVPALSPVWIPMPVPMRTVEKVSILCTSQADMEDKLRRILDGQFECPETIIHNFKQVIKDWFFVIDGQAHKRLASAILSSLNVDDNGINLNRCRRLYYGLKRPSTTVKAKLANTIRMNLGLPPTWSFHRWRNITDKFAKWDHSEKHFGVEQVQILIDAIVSCQSSPDGILQTKVKVMSAQEQGGYRFGYVLGRSVAISPL